MTDKRLLALATLFVTAVLLALSSAQVGLRVNNNVAATTALAQANSASQGVLQLLRG